MPWHPGRSVTRPTPASVGARVGDVVAVLNTHLLTDQALAHGEDDRADRHDPVAVWFGDEVESLTAATEEEHP